MDTPIISQHWRIVNRIGHQYGRLTVLSPAQKRPGRRDAQWLCVCTCGTETIVGAQALRTGDTQSCGCLQRELTGLRRFRPAIDRFLDFIQQSPEGCWLWTGHTNAKGYAVFGRGDGSTKVCLAHVFSYEHFVGPVPEGKELDHLCRVRRCVYYGHLEAVTHLENVRRGDNYHKTHCKYGHELTGENVVLTARGYRNCRMCKNIAGEKARRAKGQRPTGTFSQQHTHCRQGHPFSEDNLLWSFDKRRQQWSRRCAICSKAREKRRIRYRGVSLE